MKMSCLAPPTCRLPMLFSTSSAAGAAPRHCSLACCRMLSRLCLHIQPNH
jgi:hypothetical protein